MADKIIYLFDKETKKYIGQEFAYESASKRGEYIIPENATTVVPPESIEGYDLVFNGKAWQRKKQEDVVIDEKQKQIAELKMKLQKNDFKNLKNLEAQLAGLPLPYDPVELHNIMQSWRNQIDKLEKESAQ